jgi:hypothetical protein
VLLIIVGLLSWILYVVRAGDERHAYAHGGAPPDYVEVHSGHTYWIAIPGGVHTESDEGLDPSALRCTAAISGQGPTPLVLSAEGTQSKATDQIASFVAGLSAQVHVDCTGIGSVYVDNAADAGTDWSGLWLVLAGLALAIGLPLTLSGLRTGPILATDVHPGPGPGPDPYVAAYRDAGSIQPPSDRSN